MTYIDDVIEEGLTNKVHYILNTYIRSNVKTWRKISGALKNCALACHSDIILLQEPRIAVSLPDYTAIHSYETTKLNTAI